MKKLVIVFLFVISSAFAFESKLSNGKIYFELPTEFETVEKLFGIELMLKGPMLSSNRPIVTISNSDFKKFDFSKSLADDESSYQEGRKEWLSKNGFSIVNFDKISKNKNEVGIDYYELGMSFKIEEKVFHEKSYYLKCRNNIYHIKTLNLENEDSIFQRGFLKLIGSFKCL